MSKIFEYKAGSFIEQVSKRVATSVNLTHKRTEKGVACVFNNSATSSLLFPNTSNLNIPTGTVRTFVFNADLKFNSSRTSLFGKRISSAPFNSAPGYILFPNVEVGRIHIMIDDGANAIYLDSGIVFNHKLNHYIFTVDRVNNVMYLECNGVKGTEISIASLTANVTNDFDFGFKTYQSTNKPFADVLDLKVYDHILSAKERTDLYRDFLQSQITEKPVRGFELVKPTDLSYQKTRGLFAAYNFKRNGNILTDISGNGNNFTISPGVVTQDNGLLFPLTNATITPSMLFPAGSKTVCWRGIVHSVPGTFARIYGSYLLFNSNLRVFYRAQSDTVVTIYTGLSATQFGKEFDLVFVQESNNSQKLYINGVLVGTSATETTSVQQIEEISSTGANAGIITHKDLRFYTRAFSDDEVKAYHNSWIKPEIIEDWSGSAVGDTI